MLFWGTWVCPSKGQCGGGATACIRGALVAPGSQGSQWLGQQEVWCSRRAWKSTLVFLPGESHRQKRLVCHSPQVFKESATTEVTLHAWMQDVFYTLAVLFQWGSCIEAAQLLGSQGPWQCWLRRSASSFCYRRHGVIMAFPSLWQS